MYTGKTVLQNTCHTPLRASGVVGYFTKRRYTFTFTSWPRCENEGVLTCDRITLTFDLSTSKWGYRSSFLSIFSDPTTFHSRLTVRHGTNRRTERDIGHHRLKPPPYGTHNKVAVSYGSLIFTSVILHLSLPPIPLICVDLNFHFLRFIRLRELLGKFPPNLKFRRHCMAYSILKLEDYSSAHGRTDGHAIHVY